MPLIVDQIMNGYLEDELETERHERLENGVGEPHQPWTDTHRAKSSTDSDHQLCHLPSLGENRLRLRLRLTVDFGVGRWCPRSHATHCRPDHERVPRRRTRDRFPHVCMRVLRLPVGVGTDASSCY
jgi:hypothetical protein